MITTLKKCSYFTHLLNLNLFIFCLFINMALPTKNEGKSSLLNSKFFLISVILLCVILVILLLFILFFHKKDNNQDNNNQDNYTQKSNTYKNSSSSSETNAAGCGYVCTQRITENIIKKLCDADSNCKGYYCGSNDDNANGFIMSSIIPSPSNTDCDQGGRGMDTYTSFKTKADNYNTTDNKNPNSYVCIDKSDKTLNFPGSCRGRLDCEDKIRLLCDNSDNCMGYYKNSAGDTFIAATKNPNVCDQDNSRGSEYDSDEDSYQNDYIYFMEKNK